jgi:NDP-sugar pyrophosphorylase family protein
MKNKKFPTEEFFGDLDAFPFRPESENPYDWLREKPKPIKGEKTNPNKYYEILPHFAVLGGRVVFHETYDIEPFVYIEDSEIGERAHIEAGVRIADSIIGSDISIESSSRITNSVIGDGVKIGSHAKIKNSVVADDAKINDHVSFLDGVAGHGTRLSSGLVTRNRLHNQEIINVKYGGKLYYGRKVFRIPIVRYSTPWDKFSGLFGDYSRTSCSFTPVGCLVGMHSLIECYVAPRYVPPETHAEKVGRRYIFEKLKPRELKRLDLSGHI